MTESQVLDAFRKTGALLDGHFILRSGHHSRQFFQCAQLLSDTKAASQLCSALAEKFDPDSFDTVISPALGGLIVGHELARHFGKRHIFAEKVNDSLVLRRGFKISDGERFLIAEDVVTLGGRVRETLTIVKDRGGIPVAVGTLVFRGAEAPDLNGVPLISLLRLVVESFPPDQLPDDLKNSTAVKPGS